MPRVSYAIAALLVAASHVGQEVSELHLPPASGRLAPELKVITSLTELRDGRVFLTDPRGAGLLLLDFEHRIVTTVGRKGQGPREFGFAAPVFSLGGDSSVMASGMPPRWLFIVREEIRGTLYRAPSPNNRSPGCWSW
jgi:hypothetical protein